jgi:hypothetical protein
MTTETVNSAGRETGASHWKVEFGCGAYSAVV